MRCAAAILIACWLLFASAQAAAELVIIANPASGVEKLTRDEAVNIFMGRYRRLPSGMAALPMDENGEKAVFYRALLGKELPEVQSYWARLVFSGQGSPRARWRMPTRSSKRSRTTKARSATLTRKKSRAA